MTLSVKQPISVVGSMGSCKQDSEGKNIILLIDGVATSRNGKSRFFHRWKEGQQYLSSFQKSSFPERSATKNGDVRRYSISGHTAANNN